MTGPLRRRAVTIWRHITRLRHATEASTLRLARRVGPLAMLPISIMCCFWWLLMTLPVTLLGIPAFSLAGSADPTARLIGNAIIWLLLTPYAIIVLCRAAPWLFRWYAIGVGLTFYRPAMADRKSAELAATLG